MNIFIFLIRRILGIAILSLCGISIFISLFVFADGSKHLHLLRFWKVFEFSIYLAFFLVFGWLLGFYKNSLIVKQESIQQRVRSAPTLGIADELVKLEQLWQSGVINFEEYEQQKDKLLNS